MSTTRHSEAVSHDELRSGVRELCSRFPDEYWRKVDRKEDYPEAFVNALTEAGWLAALIPEEYGGSGLCISDASVILEEINRSGANAGACHAQMYIMGTLLRHGSADQKERYLPRIASGDLRLQAFGVTEPDAGLDTTQIRTRARGPDLLARDDVLVPVAARARCSPTSCCCWLAPRRPTRTTAGCGGCRRSSSTSRTPQRTS